MFSWNWILGKGDIPIRRCSIETIRRQYTSEFKRDAVALVIEHGYAMTVAPRNRGITALWPQEGWLYIALVVDLGSGSDLGSVLTFLHAMLSFIHGETVTAEMCGGVVSGHLINKGSGVFIPFNPALATIDHAHPSTTLKPIKIPDSLLRLQGGAIRLTWG